MTKKEVGSTFFGCDFSFILSVSHRKPRDVTTGFCKDTFVPG